MFNLILLFLSLKKESGREEDSFRFEGAAAGAGQEHGGV